MDRILATIARNDWTGVGREIRTIQAVTIMRLLNLLILVLIAASGMIADAWSDVGARETSAREALLVDFNSGAVLLSKDADKPMPPASMSKIMTAYLAFEHLATGRLSFDDEVIVSENAWRKGGSRMFLEIGSRVTVADILRGIIVQSGNDSAIALAETMYGSEAAFADAMTAKARELGMTNSEFRNATGWPDPEHQMTARDLATLAAATIRNFPQYYPLYAEESFTYNDINQPNRNPLLKTSTGADGLKTGFTQAAGYGLTASVIRDGRRLILVVNGLKRSRTRAREASELVEWGFRAFTNHTLFKAGEAAERAPVWLGDSSTVTLVPEQDVVVTVPRNNNSDVRVSVHYIEPIPAPITRGQPVATLRIVSPGLQETEVPLVAGEDIEKLGFLRRGVAAILYYLWGLAT